jgi:hypothetical protein
MKSINISATGPSWDRATWREKVLLDLRADDDVGHRRLDKFSTRRRCDVVELVKKRSELFVGTEIFAGGPASTLGCDWLGQRAVETGKQG